MSQESVGNPPVNLYTPTGDGSAVIILQSECDIDPGAFVSLEAERQDITKIRNSYLRILLLTDSLMSRNQSF